jgi:neutral amino acid transport system permease protein
VLILGGAARVFGPVLGSVIFWFLLIASDNLLLAEAVRAGYIPSSPPPRSARCGSSSWACP